MTPDERLAVQVPLLEEPSTSHPGSRQETEMKMEDIHIGMRLIDAEHHHPVTVTAVGDARVLCRWQAIGADGKEVSEEISYAADELLERVEYPELVFNIYRPDLFFSVRPPVRYYTSSLDAFKDPDFGYVLGQVFVHKDGMVYMVPLL